MIFYYLCSIWCLAIIIGSWKQQQSGTGICVTKCLFEYTNQNRLHCAMVADATKLVSTINEVIWYAVFIGPHLILLMTTIYINIFVHNNMACETPLNRRQAKNATRELVSIYFKLDRSIHLLIQTCLFD